MYINQTPIPVELQQTIGTEKIEFAVQPKRNRPVQEFIPMFVIGTVFIVFSSFMLYFLWWPVLNGGSVDLTVNDVDYTVTAEDTEPLNGPTVLIGLFTLVGFLLNGIAFYNIFRNAGIYVATPTRLIHFRSGKIESLGWDHFENNIIVKGTDQKGSVFLKRRFIFYYRKKAVSSVALLNIENAYAIAETCRKHIAECYKNNPELMKSPGTIFEAVTMLIDRFKTDKNK
ncbi:MAG: hypothetical protein Fur0041_20520 [Bacteroidia bacterium]